MTAGELNSSYIYQVWAELLWKPTCSEVAVSVFATLLHNIMHERLRLPCACAAYAVGGLECAWLVNTHTHIHSSTNFNTKHENMTTTAKKQKQLYANIRSFIHVSSLPTLQKLCLEFFCFCFFLKQAKSSANRRQKAHTFKLHSLKICLKFKILSFTHPAVASNS